MDKNPVVKFRSADVNYGRHIGQGGFGMVFEGILKGEKIAIKVPKEEMVTWSPVGIPGEIKQLLEHIFVEEELRPSFARIKILLNDIRKGNGNLSSGISGIFRDCQQNQSQNLMEGQSLKSDNTFFKLFNNIKEFFTTKSVNIREKGVSWSSDLNSPGIGIKEFKLNRHNVENLSSFIENNTLEYLRCVNISTKKIPEILQKFKATQKLHFWHNTEFLSEKCKYFGSSFGVVSEDCIFNLPQMYTLENLKELWIGNLEINTGDVNNGPANLPNLKILSILLCHIRGNLVDTIATHLFALEEISFWGNTPLLEMTDVEKLLRIKSLKNIQLNKNGDQQIISGSFSPIGPDGKMFSKITQNAKISFKRHSNNLPWKMTKTKSIF